MENQFQRCEWIYSLDYLNKIQDKKIAIFGLGGVGGSAAEALARFGFKHFLIVDNDVVNLTNINRQVIATHSSVGKSKVEVMKARLLDINPEIEVITSDVFLLEINDFPFDLKEYDFVVDAIDTTTAKLNLIQYCVENNINIISSLGCGNRKDPSKLQIMDLDKTSYDPLAKVMRKELGLRGIKHLPVVCSTEIPVKAAKEENGRHIPGSSTFVPPVAGIMLAQYVAEELLK